MQTTQHEYVALIMNTGIKVSSKDLPPVLHTIRETENIRLPHGNKIRTELLEKGVFEITTKRKDSDEQVAISITVNRWIEIV